VVLVSSELPELIGMSDRILMLHEGRITGEFEAKGVTQEALMEAALG
jgi:ribose transport system ATP-binding protein